MRAAPSLRVWYGRWDEGTPILTINCFVAAPGAARRDWLEV
ncbi:MAG TPA: hypothetical protein VF161_01035 [Steroidobacteraceae bacterium]|jgi:hypothetical protein